MGHHAKILATAALFFVGISGAAARAEEQPGARPGAAYGGPTPQATSGPTNFPEWPRLSGHFGFAVSLFSIDNDGTTVIGRNYIQVGVTPGITVKIADHWSVDFEFIGFSRWDRHDSAPDTSRTSFLVDPGVVYNFGKVSAGLRLAVLVGEGNPANVGFIPIVVYPIRIAPRVSYFFELDLPVFVTGVAGATSAGNRTLGSFGAVFQSGFAF